MALPKLFNLITWHNNTTPAINEDNLNAMSEAIDNIDDRVIGLAGTITEDVAQIQEDIEEIEGYMDVIDDKVDAATTAANNANTSKNAAASQALVSEGYAKGTQNGTPVGSTSPYYHNNAEYFMEEARTFTPEGYQDLVEEVSDLNTEVNSVKTALVNNVNANGSKNILPLLCNDGTRQGITIVNKGGYLEVSGTATGTPTSISLFNTELEAVAPAYGKAKTLEELGIDRTKKYIFARPASSGGIRYSLWFFNGETYITDIELNSQYVEIDFANDYPNCDRIKASLVVSNGATISAGTVFKPMFCLKSDYDLDPTWVPFAEPNIALSKNKVSWEDEAQIGAVNLGEFPYYDMNGATSGITYSTDKNGVLSISGGTVSSSSPFALALWNNSSWIKQYIGKTLKLKLFPIGANIELQFRVKDASDNVLVSTNASFANGANTEYVFNVPSNADKVFAQIYAARSAVLPAANLTFMICPPSYNGPYAPPAKTNKELTDDVKGLLSSIDYSKLTFKMEGNASYPLTINKKTSWDALVILFNANVNLALMVKFETADPSPTIRSLSGDVSTLSAAVSGNALTISNSNTSARLWGATFIIVAERS